MVLGGQHFLNLGPLSLALCDFKAARCCLDSQGPAEGGFQTGGLPHVGSGLVRPFVSFWDFSDVFSGKKKAHKLKNNPQHTCRVSMEHPAGQTGVYRQCPGIPCCLL